MSSPFQCLITVTTAAGLTPASIYDILTKATVPTGFTRSRDSYKFGTNMGTGAVISNVLADLGTCCRELNLQVIAGQFYLGTDVKMSASDYAALYPAPATDRWRDRLNTISLPGMFLFTDTDASVIAVWGMYA